MGRSRSCRFSLQCTSDVSKNVLSILKFSTFIFVGDSVCDRAHTNTLVTNDRFFFFPPQAKYIASLVKEKKDGDETQRVAKASRLFSVEGF